MTPPLDPPVIHASALSEYGYCARAWWLQRVEGIPSAHDDALLRGHRVHQRHGRSVGLARLLLVAAIALFLLAVGWIVVGTLP